MGGRDTTGREQGYANCLGGSQKGTKRNGKERRAIVSWGAGDYPFWPQSKRDFSLVENKGEEKKGTNEIKRAISKQEEEGQSLMS